MWVCVGKLHIKEISDKYQKLSVKNSDKFQGTKQLVSEKKVQEIFKKKTNTSREKNRQGFKYIISTSQLVHLIKEGTRQKR